MSVAAAHENGLPESDEAPHENGVDGNSDDFFESISEPASVKGHADVTAVKDEDIPSLAVDKYTPEERSHLEDVLQRYKDIYHNEGERQQQLKKDLDSSAVKEIDEGNGGKVCHCCGQSLTFLINPGRPCAQCSSQSCPKCLKKFRRGNTKMCQLCYLEDMHEGRSGKWFMKNLQESGRSPIFGTDVLRASLRRLKEEEDQKRHEEEDRQRRAAEEAAAAQAAAAAAELESQRSDSRHSSKSDKSSTLTKKFKFGKKSKKDAPDLDTPSVAERASEPIREERAVDVAPSIPDSDAISSMSHAVPPPAGIDDSVEEGTIVTTPSVHPSDSVSHVPTIVVEENHEDGGSWQDRPYVNEEDHIFPEDDPEADSMGLRPPSHGGSKSSTMMSQESIVSIYSDTSAGYRLAVDVTGDIQVGLDYDFKHNVFFVKIKQARDVAAVDTKRKKSDPYVKSYLLPDKTKISKRKTSYRKNTLNPEFDEQLKYVISKSDLETRVLSVAVWHRVAFGHNIFLGEAHIPMENYEFGDATPRWYPLHEKKDIAIPMPLMMYKGDLILAVKYVPGADIMSVSSGKGGETRGEVHAWIKEAKNLVAARANGYSDPFCKGYLLPDKSKSGKKKTRVIKRNLNPAWNTVLRFTDVEEEDLPDHCLELSIWDHGRFSSNEFLGGLRLNLGLGVYKGQHVKWMDSKGHEITMWQAMISRPNTWIEGTLMLRPNMD